MKIRPGAPLQVSLQWDSDTVVPVGRLAYRERRAFLEWDGALVRSGIELSPVRHPVRPGVIEPFEPYVFDGLHGVFADSLPDGWGRLLLDRRARQRGVEPAALTPLDRLACVGRTGIGALIYTPVTEVWAHDRDGLDLDALADNAQRVLAGGAADLLDTLGKAGGSPAGARPKVLVALNAAGEAVHGADHIPDGFSPWLVKFRGAGDPADIAAMEYAYARLAAAAGVEMAGARLISGAGGQRYFATERFDRVGNRRRHVHTASGLLYADARTPSLDYRDLIRLTRVVTRDRREAVKMVRLAVFNVLAHNRDDHARQFSFLMDRDGVWRLAPAYDLTFAEGAGGEHATAVLGHGRDITRAQLRRLGREADLSDQEIDPILDEVATAVSGWERAARDCDVSAASRESVARRLQAVWREIR